MRAGWAGDDVWDLPPISTQQGDTEELNGVTGWGSGKVHYWRSDPVARTWHDCSSCRDIIGKGDPYHREAIPMHTQVLVFKQCCKCK